jgi:phenylacetate-CoA ligase
MIGEILELGRLRQHSRLAPSALEKLTQQKLRAVIRHAYENVSYYRSLFESAGLSPEDVRTVEDLKYIPITRKEDLRAAGLERITARGVDLSSCIVSSTTGSTGKPFTVYCTRSEARTRRLLEVRALLSMGFHPRDRLAVLGPEHPHRTRLHQGLGFYRSGNIPPFLSIEDQILRLQSLRPTVLWAYPTVLRALLHRVDYRLSEVVRPRALITSAEVLDEVLRQRIRADLDIEMFNFYGAIEAGRIASECPAHEGLHVNTDHVALECLDGERPAEAGTAGVVVITTLNAFAMPFIRYRMGDICTMIDKTCACGSPFPLIGSPRGRESDMIQLPSGKVLSPIAFGFILRRFEGINQFRFIQESSDHLVLQLVPQGPPQEEMLGRLRSQILEYLTEPVRVDIQLVDFIREDTSKFRAFVSRLPEADP